MEGNYVAITRGRVKRGRFDPKQTMLAAGPFASYDEALQRVSSVRNHMLLNSKDPESRLWGFGVIPIQAKELPEGKLNKVLQFTPTAPFTPRSNDS